jgi:hypothetical protein
VTESLLGFFVVLDQRLVLIIKYVSASLSGVIFNFYHTVIY